VGQHHLRGDVADRVDAGNVGAAVVVDLDGAALGELHAGLVETVALDPGSEAHGLQHLVGGQHLLLATLGRLDGDLNAGTGVHDRLHRGAGEHLDAELAVCLGELGADFRVLGGNHAVEILDDGDVDTVGVEHVGEFGADGSGTTDDDGRRELLGQDQLLIGEHIGRFLGAGQQLCRGAGGDDAVVEGDVVDRPVVGGHGDGLGIDEAAPAVKLGDLVLLHQEVDAFDHPVGDRPAAAERLTVVERDVVAGDTEGRSVPEHDVGDFGVAQQRLGRNTADVEADASPPLLLNDCSFQTQLRSADCGYIPARPGTEDDDVEM